MSAVCPNGHTSGAEDFCDTCGAKIDLENQPEAAAAPEPEAAVGAGSSAEARLSVRTVTSAKVRRRIMAGLSFVRCPGSIVRSPLPVLR